MPSRRKNFGAADVANLAKSNPYVARLLEDAKLRNNLRVAADSSKRLYERIQKGKVTPRSLLDDKKVQGEVRKTIESLRAAAEALSEAPKRRTKKARRAGRAMLIAAVGGAAALAGSEKLRSKVLDVLFGAEEEFEYTPPASTTPPAPASAPASSGSSGGSGGDKAPTTEPAQSAQPATASAPKSGSSSSGGSSESSSS